MYSSRGQQFGKLLFDDFDRNDWLDFYIFIFRCVQLYLDDGLEVQIYPLTYELRTIEGGDTSSGRGDGKSESACAPVDLTPTCLDALRAHQKRQAEEKLKAGEKYRDMDLIFATAKGGPFQDINVVRRVFRPALKAAGIRSGENLIRFHDLRHTCASLLIAQGESPKYVQKQMRRGG